MTDIAIVGNGAIGNLIALRCAQQQRTFALLTRSQQPFTLTCRDMREKIQITPELVTLEELSSADVIILPLKAYQIEPTLLQMQPHVREDTTIVLLHNGMGTQTRAAQAINNPLVAATTSHGAYKPSPTECIITGQGPSFAGWVSNTSDAAPAIEDLLQALLPPCQWMENVTPALWQKLAVNAVINPLTAIHQCKNGDVLHPRFANIISDLCDELARVMTASQLPVDKQTLIDNVNKVAQNTADNYSSMNRDVYFRRHTEIEFINGFVVNEAGRLGLKVPVNESMLCKVRALEQTF